MVVDNSQITLEPDHLNHVDSLNSATASQGWGSAGVRDGSPRMATPYALPMNPPEVAVGSSLRRAVVIGAGPAGLSAASRLALAGVDVTVLEKSRGIGGRVATRRTRDGLAFDHGAQFVTARGTSFGAFLQGASEIGCASEWNPITDPSRFHVATGSTDTASSGPASQWFVGTPGMSSLFKNLAAGLTIRTEVTVTHRSGPFDAAIIAIPAAQASAVAGHLDGVAASLARVVITPCWALMLAFSGDLQMPSDVFRRSEGPIAWVARNTSKPGRAPEVTTFVVHASPEWTREHLEDNPGTIATQLFDALPAVVGRTLPDPQYAVSHRWRYAQTAVPLASPFLEAVNGRVLIGGDWATGARVEAAWESGEAMALRLLSQ
ncbi:MAG: FAD-binding protein [Chloroflexi bacterium]|nr:FAD-binding protein [Chloroflexota bacterium]